MIISKIEVIISTIEVIISTIEVIISTIEVIISTIEVIISTNIYDEVMLRMPREEYPDLTIWLCQAVEALLHLLTRTKMSKPCTYFSFSVIKTSLMSRDFSIGL